MNDEYKYQPDSPHVASSIQTHDDPYRNTRTQPPTADRDDLAAILAKHDIVGIGRDPVTSICRCGVETIADGPRKRGYTPEHRAHVAQMVLESDWLRGELDKAWCNGYHAGDCGEPDNPYRADRVDAEDGGR